ncbi:hypothetical protein [Sphingomonas sp. UYP23]
MSDGAAQGRKRHLGVGTRLAIVASVLWMIGGSLAMWGWMYLRSLNVLSTALTLCNNYTDSNRPACYERADGFQTQETYSAVWDSIEVAAILLALAWLVLGGGGRLALKVGRWVAAGRRQGDKV